MRDVAMRDRNRTTSPERHRSPRTGGLLRVVLVAILAAAIVPLEYSPADAVPVTLSETLTGLEPDPDGVAVGSADADAASPTEAGLAHSALVEAPIAFSALGMRAPAAAEGLAVRTSEDGQRWSEWQPLGFMEVEDGPDPGSAEDQAVTAGKHTEALWVGEATHLQVEVTGDGAATLLGELEVTFIDSMRLNGGPVERVSDAGVGAEAGASDLDIVSRAQWGADESLGSGTRTASRVNMIVVHHTAHRSGSSANTYTRAEAPGLIRAMHRYHTRSLGWSDIGYNALVDRYGTIYEGRKGGFANAVIGAHASGFNAGSFGVSVIGNFLDEQAPPAAIAALTQVIGAAAGVYDIDPTGTTTRMGDGTRRPTVVGHRDVGRTSCPGRIQGLLPQIRSDARPMAVRFPDVPSSSPHREAILNLAEAGVTSGCRTNAFCPTDQLNRGQASSFVAQAFGIPPLAGRRFSDVPAGNAHVGSINALGQRGLMRGYDSGDFGPWDEMKRGQLATLLARTMGLSTDPLPAWSPGPYADVAATYTHAPAIAALKERGIVGNCGGGRFCPEEVVRRDSTASFVHMVMQVQGLLPADEPATVSPSSQSSDDPTGEASVDDG